MSESLPHWAMANAITSFTTIGAGLLTLAMWWLLPGQPKRWGHAYLWIFLTGIPTLGMHGYGEPFDAASLPWWSVADTGSNLILAWALQVAVLGDFWSRRVVWSVGGVSLLANLAGIGKMIEGHFYLPERVYLVPLGSFGGFYPGESLLIFDSLLVTALLYLSRARITPAARPLLNLVAGCFALGLGLATANNQQVADLFGEPVIAFHALWHIAGSFAFMVLFVFNVVRFGWSGGARASPFQK